jgi:large-conductance mechanosensitive channel
MDTKKQLADFITNNGVIGVTAGVTIALVSKDAILSLIQDIVIPLVVIFLIKLKIKELTKILPYKDNGLNITKFVGCFITWILAIFCTYLFIQYAFIYLLGAKGKNSSNSSSSSDASNAIADIA